MKRRQRKKLRKRWVRFYKIKACSIVWKRIANADLKWLKHFDYALLTRENRRALAINRQKYPLPDEL